MRTIMNFRILSTIAILLVATVGAAEERPKLKQDKLGNTPNVTSFGKNMLCGQPSKLDFAQARKRGIEVVITLRGDGEIDWDEAAAIQNLGLEFHSLSFRAPDTLKDDIFDKALKLLANSDKAPVLLHCGSANRVGAVWLVHRVINDGISLDAARKEAKKVGLRTAGYEDKALAYIKRQDKEK